VDWTQVDALIEQRIAARYSSLTPVLDELQSRMAAATGPAEQAPEEAAAFNMGYNQAVHKATRGSMRMVTMVWACALPNYAELVGSANLGVLPLAFAALLKHADEVPFMHAAETKTERETFYRRFPKELRSFSDLTRALSTYQMLARSAVLNNEELSMEERSRGAAMVDVAVQAARDWVDRVRDRAPSPATFLAAFQARTLEEL
jgi:hypothetical protein